MKTIKLFITLAIIASTSFSFAQANSDESIIELPTFLTVVAENHPVVKKAKLISTEGELELRKARGKFDPILYNYFDQKSYKNTNYYSKNISGLKIPTWYGIEFNANLDANNSIENQFITTFLTQQIIYPVKNLNSCNIF